ncbi:bis(5'-nucleosyl)-tetraphosphatase [Mycoplasmopsis arginini]|uniref:bis(5'-nucleosyl)-tetraphosphatase n=1 Tax=Mycoplasmopsis arginini TaxID=2094 RepID=UPI003D042B44
MRNEKSCGAVVLRNKGSKAEVLLVQQRAGHWTFPKGHVEGNETEIETALREVKEETNLDVDIIEGFREITSYSFINKDRENVNKNVIFFLATPKNDDKKNRPGEIEVVDWFSIDKAREQITHDANREVLEKALNFYVNNCWKYK